MTIVIALLEGPNEGARSGSRAASTQDFLMNEPKGLTALTLTLLGYAVGMFRQFIISPSPLVPTVVVVAVGTAAGLAFYEVVSLLLGNLDDVERRTAFAWPS